MAKAKKVKAEYELQLTLSRAEAETLLFVCGRIGGCSMDSPRKHTDELFRALKDAGVAIEDLQTSATDRAIYFKQT